jgi:hypothetical protein
VALAHLYSQGILAPFEGEDRSIDLCPQTREARPVGFEEQVIAKLDAAMGMGGANLPVADVIPSGDSPEIRILKLEALVEVLRDLILEAAREVDQLSYRLDEGGII